MKALVAEGRDWVPSHSELLAVHPALSGRGQSDTGDGLSLLLLPRPACKEMLASSGRKRCGFVVPGLCIPLELEASHVQFGRDLMLQVVPIWTVSRHVVSRIKATTEGAFLQNTSLMIRYLANITQPF